MENLIKNNISENLNFLRRTNSYNFIDAIPGDKLINANESHTFNLENKVYLLIDTACFIRNGKNSIAITDEYVSFAWGDFLDGFETLKAYWGFFENLEVHKVESFINGATWMVEGERQFASIHFEDEQFITKVLNIINEINKGIKYQFDIVNKEINKLKDANNPEKLISNINEWLNLPYLDKLELMRIQIVCLIEKMEYENALNSIADIIAYINTKFNEDPVNWNDSLKEYFGEILEYGAVCENQTGKSYSAVFDSTASIDFSKGSKPEREKIRNDSYENFKKTFLEIPTKERKVILTSNQFIQDEPNKFIFLHINSLPELKFEVNHPQHNELYVIHPFKQDVYYHIARFDEIMFQDKLMELNLILQCLGAKTIKLMKQESTTEKVKDTSNNSASGSVSGIINSAEVQTKLEGEKYTEQKTTRKIVSEQHFEPDKEPHIPDNLNWFEHEIVWQKLSDQRFNSNITKSIISMSSHSSEFLTISERKEILAEFKVFILNLKGSFDSHNYLEKFLEEENEWSIEVEFALKSELKSKSESMLIDKIIDKLNSNEKEFEEFLFDCIEDGNISDDERKLIERKRIKLNISEERAKQMEDQVWQFGNANESEREYLEELEFCYSGDGLISEDERRILEKLRIKLVISEQRALELEKQFKSNYISKLNK